MSKRRTRKQKESAKHNFSLSWGPSSQSNDPEAKTSSDTSSVKRQTENSINATKSKNNKPNSANSTAVYENLGSIKHNLIKSLIISSLILSLELVLYFTTMFKIGG